MRRKAEGHIDPVTSAYYADGAAMVIIGRIDKAALPKPAGFARLG
jgi:hypothetical protein